MKYNGLPIDGTKGAGATEHIEKLRGKIAFIIGDIHIGANASTTTFKQYLFDTLKLPKMKLTTKEQDALYDKSIILLKRMVY